MDKLDTCWKDCLRMWKCIAGECSESMSVGCLKTSWLVANGFSGMHGNCFFCQYDYTEGGKGDSGCELCPAVLVDDSFRCWRAEYRYQDNPKAFYAKLLELDATRKENKDEGQRLT